MLFMKHYCSLGANKPNLFLMIGFIGVLGMSFSLPAIAADNPVQTPSAQSTVPQETTNVVPAPVTTPPATNPSSASGDAVAPTVSVTADQSSAPTDATVASTVTPDARDAINALSEKWKNVSSMKATISIEEYDNGNLARKYDGKIEYKAQTELIKYLIAMNTSFNDSTRSPEKAEVLFDGNLEFITVTSDGQPEMESGPLSLTVPPPGGKLIFDLLERDFFMHLDKDASHLKQVVIIGEPKDLSCNCPKKNRDFRAEFDMETGRLLAFSRYQGTELRLKVSYSSPDFNVEIDDALFTPPKILHN